MNGIPVAPPVSTPTSGEQSSAPQELPKIPTITPIAQSQPIPSQVPELPSIEGVGQSSQQQAGYRVDPFGPMNPSTQPAVNQAAGPPEPPSILPNPPPPASPEPPITPPPDHAQFGKETAADLLGRMPSIAQMMKDLEKSGCLLPELKVTQSQHVDTSPLAALQPNRLNNPSADISTPSSEQPKPILPEVQLASTGKPIIRKKAKEPVELPLFVFTGVVCFIQAMQGVTQVIHFFLIEYPRYEQLVINGVMTTTDVNAAVVKGLIIAGLALVSFVTLFVLLAKRSTNHSPSFYFSVTLIVLNFYVQNIMVAGQFASGSPLVLPETIGEILSRG